MAKNGIEMQQNKEGLFNLLQLAGTVQLQFLT